VLALHAALHRMEESQASSIGGGSHCGADGDPPGGGAAGEEGAGAGGEPLYQRMSCLRGAIRREPVSPGSRAVRGLHVGHQQGIPSTYCRIKRSNSGGRDASLGFSMMLSRYASRWVVLASFRGPGLVCREGREGGRRLAAAKEVLPGWPAT